MMHWKGLATAEKIEAIKSAHLPGLSARAIAARIGGDVSRNAVIGFYGRYPTELRTHPLNPAAETRKQSLLEPKLVRRKAEQPLRLPRPVPPPFTATFQHVAGMPLMMLTAQRCGFAVNDAARGEEHLFCGVEGDSRWCPAHRRIVYRQERPRP